VSQRRAIELKIVREREREREREMEGEGEGPTRLCENSASKKS